MSTSRTRLPSAETTRKILSNTVQIPFRRCAEEPSRMAALPSAEHGQDPRRTFGEVDPAFTALLASARSIRDRHLDFVPRGEVLGRADRAHRIFRERLYCPISDGCAAR